MAAFVDAPRMARVLCGDSAQPGRAAASAEWRLSRWGAQRSAMSDAPRQAPHSALSADTRPPRTLRDAAKPYRTRSRPAHTSPLLTPSNPWTLHPPARRSAVHAPGEAAGAACEGHHEAHQAPPTPADAPASSRLTWRDAPARGRDRTRGIPPAQQPLPLEFHSTRPRSRGATTRSESRSRWRRP